MTCKSDFQVTKSMARGEQKGIREVRVALVQIM